MSVKTLLGTVMMAALMGVATQASATPSFQLRIVSGTFDSGAITTPGGGVVQSAVAVSGGGGNKFNSSGLFVQGAYNYDNAGTLYMSLDVPDITHKSSTPGSITFYLTLYNVTSPTGTMNFKYDLSGSNADLAVAGPDNSSQGHFYYSATNSSNPVLNPGVALITTPVIDSNFASTPDCHLAAPGSLSYSCEYIQGVTLTPTYSITERLTLNYAQNTNNKTARGQQSMQVPFVVPEPASLAILGSGLLAAGARFRRKKAAKQAV
jgi:PEP-CTERM motif